MIFVSADGSNLRADIVAEAWADEEKLGASAADLAAVAKEEGIPHPAGLTLRPLLSASEGHGTARTKGRYVSLAVVPPQVPSVRIDK